MEFISLCLKCGLKWGRSFIFLNLVSRVFVIVNFFIILVIVLLPTQCVSLLHEYSRASSIVNVQIIVHVIYLDNVCLDGLTKVLNT